MKYKEVKDIFTHMRVGMRICHQRYTRGLNIETDRIIGIITSLIPCDGINSSYCCDKIGCKYYITIDDGMPKCHGFGESTNIIYIEDNDFLTEDEFKI